MGGRVKIGWHFLPDNGKLCNGDGRVPKVGQWIEMLGDQLPEPGERGMHSSKRIVDALIWASGSLLSQTEVRGQIKKKQNQYCGRFRRIIKMADASRLLDDFTYDIASEALKRVDPDRELLDLLSAKKALINGNMSYDELTRMRKCVVDGMAARYHLSNFTYAVFETAVCASLQPAWLSAQYTVWYASVLASMSNNGQWPSETNENFVSARVAIDQELTKRARALLANAVVEN